MVLYCQVAVQANNCVYEFLNAEVYPNVMEYQGKAAIQMSNESNETFFFQVVNHEAHALMQRQILAYPHTVHIHDIVSRNKNTIKG